jgi:fatty-acid desaturase
MAMTSTQKGVPWWAAGHRHRHRYPDTEDDLHSASLRGFLCGRILVGFCHLETIAKKLHKVDCPFLRATHRPHAKNWTSAYFLGSGGNFLNIFSTPLSRLSMFFSDLLESVSLAEPRHTRFLVFASNRSTMRVPTL